MRAVQEIDEGVIVAIVSDGGLEVPLHRRLDRRHRRGRRPRPGHLLLTSAGPRRAAAGGLASSDVDDRPIGMFDSGFGGLTVARAVIDLLPGEDLVYLGDTGRYPYGPRPLDEVRGFARRDHRRAWSPSTA